VYFVVALFAEKPRWIMISALKPVLRKKNG
jgi:hypothetical protein